ncbi:MAG: efflux RND transporter periplasmic adaptor subunit [Candidatus Krumholzibacteriia bacterium]
MQKIIKSKNSLLGACAIIVVVAAILFVIPGARHQILGLLSSESTGGEASVYYTCPMHPDIRLPQPGECPICGMTLVEKEAGDEEQTGTVAVTTQQSQLTGITIEPIKERELYREIDTYGKVDYDETKLGVVAAWVGGRIDRLFIDFTGVTVKKGHPLVELYSPNLISSEREYLLALENLDKVERSGFEEATRNARELVASTRQRLLWLGLSDKQLDKIAATRTPDEHIIIYAPQGGTVIEKKAYPGMYVKEGDVLFKVADLSRVWLYADIYEDEIPYLYEDRPGDYYECAMHPEVRSDKPIDCWECGMALTRSNKSLKVRIETRSFPGETFEGYISFTDPFLDPETRTVRIRVNIDNSGLRLKPDMFARAKIRLPAGNMIAVPENAVIHSGTRKIVLVEEEKGKFRPTLVRLGRLWLNDVERSDAESQDLAFQRGSLRFHEVLAGLETGEQVVTSGNFLVSSESQLQGALAKMLEDEGQEGTDEKPGGEQRIAAADVPKKEEGRFPEIMEAYLGITDRLAKDSLEGVAELAETIVASAVNDGIKEAADSMRHTMDKSDIEAVRQDFRRLSDMIIAYIEEHGDHIAAKPNKAYCPMADARWLQAGTAIANPYYGAEMPRCGNIEPWVQ